MTEFLETLVTRIGERAWKEQDFDNLSSRFYPVYAAAQAIKSSAGNWQLSVKQRGYA